jgi:hypothetical protein
MVSSSDLLLCAPTIEAQLVLLLCHAFFWNQWIVLSSKNIFEPWSMFPTAIRLLATLRQRHLSLCRDPESVDDSLLLIPAAKALTRLSRFSSPHQALEGSLGQDQQAHLQEQLFRRLQERGRSLRFCMCLHRNPDSAWCGRRPVHSLCRGLYWVCGLGHGWPWGTL